MAVLNDMELRIRQRIMNRLQMLSRQQMTSCDNMGGATPVVEILNGSRLEELNRLSLAHLQQQAAQQLNLSSLADESDHSNSRWLFCIHIY